MKSSWCGLLLLLVAAVKSSDAYRILMVFPMGPRSEFHLMCAITDALADAGHEVTFFSTHKWSRQHPNISYHNVGSTGLDMFNLFDILTPEEGFKTLVEATISSAKHFWTNEKVKEAWKDRNKFDAVIMVGTFNEIGVPFLLDFEGAFIMVCTAGVDIDQTAHYGNWLPLSTTPMIWLPFDSSMTFMERSINVLNQLNTWYTYNYVMVPTNQKAVEEYFPNIPPVDKLYESSDLMLINGHYAMDGPAPLLPNQVEIGTITMHKPKPLPQDIQEFMDGAGEAGVIYFSLGSATQGIDIPIKYKEALLGAFRKVKQRVVWKYEEDDLDLPPNVLTRKWLPQQDILGHPNTRIFITHCGILGSQEAKYFGVPALAVPVSYDQPRNAMRLARSGYGVMLKWEDMTTETVLEAINTLLDDPMYQKRMDEVSRILHEQKESPQERTVWWVEYAIRNKDTKHLEYAGKKLHYLQYMMVDIVVVWGGLLVLCVALFCCLVVAIYRTCFKQRQNKKKRE